MQPSDHNDVYYFSQTTQSFIHISQDVRVASLFSSGAGELLLNAYASHWTVLLKFQSNHSNIIQVRTLKHSLDSLKSHESSK